MVLMRLQLWRTYGAKVMETFFRLIKIVLPLAIVSICLFGYVLHYQSEIFREFQAALLSVEWMLLACLAVWCGTFIFLTFNLKDILLIGLLLIAIFVYFIGEAPSWRMADAIILLAGVTMGKGAQFMLQSGKRKAESGNNSDLQPSTFNLQPFLIGLVLLLAFASWWHLELARNFYPGTRWTGLWDNPNDYGMLMGAGVTLAIGLLIAERSRLGCRSSRLALNLQNVNDETPLTTRGTHVIPIILFIVAGMMGVGLLFSYSRGAWFGTAVSLLYLAKVYGKLKWRYVVFGIGLVALGVLLFCGHTPDNAPWYVKRMDFGRPSTQHRVAAWCGAFQMMRDHPFGVGWNKAVSVYDKNYSPPEGGAAAITTNDYLMLGTELGLPALLCFVAYVALRLRSPKPKVQSPKLENDATLDIGHWTLDSSKTACRAGALVLLVAFWFDGGLFDLPTATVFWILLELGSVELPQRSGKAEK